MRIAEEKVRIVFYPPGLSNGLFKKRGHTYFNRISNLLTWPPEPKEHELQEPRRSAISTNFATQPFLMDDDFSWSPILWPFNGPAICRLCLISSPIRHDSRESNKTSLTQEARFQLGGRMQVAAAA